MMALPRLRIPDGWLAHAPVPAPDDPTVLYQPTQRQASMDARPAALALLVFGALHGIALLGWLVSDAPWTWRAGLTVVTTLLALALQAVLRRRPSRVLVVAGLVVMFAALARVVGAATWATAFLVVLTLALAAPLVWVLLRAGRVTPASDRAP
jgi:hypothetical protein